MRRIDLKYSQMKNDTEWDYILFQLGIPENKRDDIAEIEITVEEFSITDRHSNYED